MYSIEASVENEDDVVSKEQTHNEANLNEEKICNEVNVEEEDVIITEKIITSEEETESNENNAIPSCSSASQSTSAYSQSPLPECTPRFLAKFELLLMDEQVSYCNKMFETNEESASAIYNAWKAL